MAKKRTALAGRAWNLMRLALYWSRKGGIFKHRILTNLLPNYVKGLRATSHNSIPSGEREFSFDKTPMFNFRSHRSASMRFRYLPYIPCINPSVAFDDNDDKDDGVYNSSEDIGFYEDEDFKSEKSDCEMNDGEVLDEGEEGIDSKAEKFIARFYQQMKLQRQASYLQYNEMLQRGTS
ncbi:hypothetical protein MRB53_027973 [Persea americana]|uniref:Uncharacterized protein n=1 Tax=Persea americana TaxID=3435 RepID=A0ACC2KEA1_PERAE|nr:hypothetical protein MRB53_027973 [Persea americana]